MNQVVDLFDKIGNKTDFEDLVRSLDVQQRIEVRLSLIQNESEEFGLSDK